MWLDWTRVTDFIARRDPELAASFKGVSRSDIDAVQRRLDVTLPSTYVDFLTTMGEASGILQPFGETQVHTFSDLVAQLPLSSYISKRFFKISFESDEFAVAFLDTYLDLSRSDGHDAPLVTFEEPTEPGRTDFPDESLTLTERLLYHIFWTLDTSGREYGARMVMFGANEKDAIAAVLGPAGFTKALPDVRRVTCLSRNSASALLSVSDDRGLVALELGADDSDELEGLVQQVLEQFPGANLQEPPARRSELEA